MVVCWVVMMADSLVAMTAECSAGMTADRTVADLVESKAAWMVARLVD
jgi:hypothetical protein